jgi:hypothetical protein
MEPSGRNQWQSVAGTIASKRAQTGKNRCRGLPTLAAAVHGKEGVDGSSPSEGSISKKYL